MKQTEAALDVKDRPCKHRGYDVLHESLLAGGGGIPHLRTAPQPPLRLTNTDSPDKISHTAGHAIGQIIDIVIASTIPHRILASQCHPQTEAPKGLLETHGLVTNRRQGR